MAETDADAPHAALRLALAARSTPEVVGNPVLQRWLDAEIGGYGVLADIQPLHALLGVDEHHPLVHRVAEYRTQLGTVFAPSGASTIAHFFVEPIAEVESIARHAREGAGTLLTVDFGPHAAAGRYPRSADFPADVFDRIVRGFVRTLGEQVRG